MVGKWSSSQQGWTTSSTSSQVGQAKLKFTLQQLFNYNGGQGGARFSQLAASSLEGHQLILIKLVRGALNDTEEEKMSKYASLNRPLCFCL